MNLTEIREQATVDNRAADVMGLTRLAERSEDDALTREYLDLLDKAVAALRAAKLAPSESGRLSGSEV